MNYCKLIFRTRHGETNVEQAFHKACDGWGSTLVITKVGKFIARGFSDRPWDGTGYKSSKNAFVFSLNRNKIYPIKETEQAVFCHPKEGLAFGRGLIRS